MPKISLRAAAAASAIVLAGLVGAAGPAAAAGASIVIEDGIAFTGEPTPVSGSCAVGSESAVVVVSQSGDLLDEQAFDVAADGSYDGALDLSAGSLGPAHAEVQCFVYGKDSPTSDGATDFFLIDSSFEGEEIEVSLSAGRVAMGGALTVSATCPTGTTDAGIQVGLSEADEPFYDEAAEVGADGAVSAVVPIRGAGAEPGPAVAVVYCGDESAGTLSAFGFAEFTITAAAAPAAGPQQPRPAGSVPVLANTGSDNGILAAVAAAMLLAGAGLIAVRRRLV